MASPGGGKPQKGVWHLSHGFVFANDTKVVYPRLPSVRHYCQPALAPRDEGGSGSAAVGEFHPGVTDVQVVGAGEQKTAVADSALVGKGTGALAVTVGEAVSVEAVAGEEDSVETAEPEPLTIPFQPLGFRIPDDVFEAARDAPEGSPESFWSYSLYRGPAGEDGTPGSKVKVHYCTSEHTTERVLRSYFMNEKLLGFDLEWAADATKNQGVRRNVSLVQLASESRIALFHLALFPKKDSFVAPALKEIMENPDITKAGVWIKGDATRLRNFMDIRSRGLFELSHLYRLIECSASAEDKLPTKKLVRMATQVEEYLRLPLFKGQDVRTSDWSEPLKMDQIIYSASDAYAAVQLYAALDHARSNLDPVPPLPHHAERDLPIRLADRVIIPAEDASEQEPIDEDADTTTTTSIAFAQYADSLSASHSLEFQDEDSSEHQQQSLTITTTTKKTLSVTTTTTTRKPKPSAVPPPPKDPRVEEADLWARQRVLARTTSASADAGKAAAGATAVKLRAYYLWHKNEGLDAEDVAGLLRDPPLATSTVVNYIVDAIRADKLAYEKRRLREEVLGRLSETALQGWRYKGLMRACRDEP